MKKILFLLIVVLLAACGKRGPLIPPEALVPAAITDLRVDQQGNRFLICWTPPGSQEWGGPLPDLAGFQVFRREVLPPGEDCEECPTAYRQVKTVDPDYLQDVRRSGSRFCFPDSDVSVGTTYQYKAVSFQKDGAVSRDSNKARRKKTHPPAPPLLTAVATPDGVTLRWKPAAIPPGGLLEGYAVYRKQAGEVMPVMPSALLAADAAHFADPHMEHGVQYLYGVRSIASIDGERVESELSNEVEGKFSLTEE